MKDYENLLSISLNIPTTSPALAFSKSTASKCLLLGIGTGTFQDAKDLCFTCVFSIQKPIILADVTM